MTGSRWTITGDTISDSPGNHSPRKNQYQTRIMLYEHVHTGTAPAAPVRQAVLASEIHIQPVRYGIDQFNAVIYQRIGMI